MNQLKIFSRYAADGSLVSTFLQNENNALVFSEEGEPALEVSFLMVKSVFARYGKPLDYQVEEWMDEPLTLTATISLRAFRFMNFGDVYKTDYLCLWDTSGESLAAPAPLVTAALKALALALFRSRTAK